MELNKYLSITPEIENALKEGKPVVALESTILSHGMPYPENVEFAHKVEEIVRGEGAVPATTAIIGGKLKVGLSSDELEIMCKADGVGKTGATTVATTMIIAAMAGIKVFATGGIGGVHRGAQETFDISADLQELAKTPVGVVCAGAKSILDIGLTLEYLETMGVPVLGMGTDDFPAFYCRKSGYKVDFNVESPAMAANILHTKWAAGMEGGAVLANPIPQEYELDFDEMEGVHGKATTPFLLSHIKDLTHGVAFASNVQLAYNNARMASKIAVELTKLK